MIALRFILALYFALACTTLDARQRLNSNWTIAYSANAVNGIAGNNLDPNGVFIGGTQVRVLAPYFYANGATMSSGAICNSSWATWNNATNTCAGLLAGNGYWEDINGPEGPQHAQIIGLDKPLSMGGKWYQDLNMLGSLTGGHGNFATVNNAITHTFTTTCSGTSISQYTIIAGTANGSNSKVYVRGALSGYTNNTVALNTGPTQEIRGIGAYIDPTNNIDYLLIGEDPDGIYIACLNNPSTGALTISGPMTFCLSATGSTCNTPCAAGTTTLCTNLPGDWGETCPGGADCQSGCNTQIIPCNAPASLRVMSIVDCVNAAGVHGQYASIMMEIWKLTPNGTSGFWTLFGKVPVGNIGTSSQSGLRGMSCAPSLTTGQALLMSTEGSQGIAWRAKLSDGSMIQEINLGTAYNAFCGGGASTGYRIDSYNRWVPFNNSMVAGEGTTDGPNTGTTNNCPGINWASGAGRNVNFVGQYPGIWVRSNPSSPTYSFIRIPPILPQYMVSAYDVVASPFPTEPNCVYVAGFDNNSTDTHNTGWIVKGCGLGVQ